MNFIKLFNTVMLNFKIFSLKLGILEDIEEMKKDMDLERQKKERLKKRQSDGEISNKNKKLKSKT